jgi:hypothetical protein
LKYEPNIRLRLLKNLGIGAPRTIGMPIVPQIFFLLSSVNRTQ